MVQTAHDGTRKLRFRTHDGRAIESVLIPDEDAGAQQADPVHLVAGRLRDRLPLLRDRDARLRAPPRRRRDRRRRSTGATALAGRRPTNLVFMGMGEPLHNFDNVTRALALLEHPWGAGFSPRRITVSTAGLVPGIEKLGALQPGAQPGDLAERDHRRGARRGSCRSTSKWPIAALLDAARRFPLSHGRRVTFEYVLLAGVNDSDADADRLPRLLRGIPAKVNLIPWNPFKGPEFQRPSAERIRTFQERLRAAGVAVYIRSPRGDDIDAACGQLAARELVTVRSPRA